MTEPGLGRPDLIAYYERLRQQVVHDSASGREGLGLALFLQRGMAAWIAAWSQCAGAFQKDTCPGPPPVETLPSNVRSQIASLLAGIILNRQVEATS